MEGARTITGLDHVVLAVRDLDQAIGAYRTLLGRDLSWRTPAAGGGAEVAMIALSNMAVELMAPAGDGDTGDRLRAVIDAEGEGLSSLVLATTDMARLHRRWAANGLAPEPIVSGESRDALTGAHRAWTRTRTKAGHGVRLFAVEAAPPLPLARATGESPVLGLDHVVIRTPNVERAAALYGARLGLDLRMDREMFGSRFLFFRCGDLIVEIVAEGAAGDGTGQLWGLSWRVADADAARARLVAAGVEVSEVRTGRKPGTRVFTVRSGACGVPTLMVGPA